MNIKVTIDTSEVERGLKKASAKTIQAAEKAMKAVVIDIANDSIHGSPVLTGNNRRSIRYEAKKLTGSIFSTSGYGGYLETGTRFMIARPYFKPALDKNFPRFADYMKDELRW